MSIRHYMKSGLRNLTGLFADMAQKVRLDEQSSNQACLGRTSSSPRNCGTSEQLIRRGKMIKPELMSI